jgi:ribosomal protein S18 acetylase RimI-like enzyme
LPKPSSIKTVQLVLYFKLALILFLLVLALLLLVIPDSFSSGWSSYRTKTIHSMFDLQPNEYKAGHLGIVALNLAPSIVFTGLTIFFVQKRKRLLAIILSLLVLWFSSSNMIQLVLSFAVVVLLFTRSSRAYFQGDAAALAPEAADATEEEDEEQTDDDSEADESDDDEPEAERSREDKPLPAARLKPSADPVVDIREASAEDAETIHALMMEAFEEFRAAVPPSSALDETVESIREALESGQEEAVILTEDGIPAAMVRYRYEEDAIQFSRLSVIPPRRKRGYARKLIQWIEQRGRSKGKTICRCKVRQSVSRNLVLYENMGYEVKDQQLVVRPEGSVKALILEKNLGPQ